MYANYASWLNTKVCINLYQGKQKTLQYDH